MLLMDLCVDPHKPLHTLWWFVVYNANTTDVEAGEASSSWKYFAKEGKNNNAFPSPSGDGR